MTLLKKGHLSYHYVFFQVESGPRPDIQGIYLFFPKSPLFQNLE